MSIMTISSPRVEGQFNPNTGLPEKGRLRRLDDRLADSFRKHGPVFPPGVFFLCCRLNFADFLVGWHPRLE